MQVEDSCTVWSENVPDGYAIVLPNDFLRALLAEQKSQLVLLIKAQKYLEKRRGEVKPAFGQRH